MLLFKQTDKSTPFRIHGHFWAPVTSDREQKLSPTTLLEASAKVVSEDAGSVLDWRALGA